jgi:lipoyl(octanoyl) transferase
MYAVLPLDRLGLGVAEYVQRLSQTIVEWAADFSVEANVCPCGVSAKGRLMAAMGVSVRDWVTTYGAYINLHPPLDLFRHVSASADETQPMTSLVRERGAPVRPSLVRERLIEHFRLRFGFARVSLFSDHPALAEAPRRLPASARVLTREEA